MCVQHVVFINRELVARGLARWVDDDDFVYDDEAQHTDDGAEQQSSGLVAAVYDC